LHDIWEKQRRREDEQIGVIGLVLMLVLELFGIDTRGNPLPSENYQEPLSPAMRQEQIYVTRYLDTVNLINRNDLSNYEKVNEFIANKEAELADWLALRNKVDNNRRRATTDEERADCSRKRKVITAEIKKLRHDINLAKDIFPMLDRLKEKLRIEMETEQEMFPRETGTKTQTKTKRNEEKER
jgi:hypothetical protein